MSTKAKRLHRVAAAISWGLLALVIWTQRAEGDSFTGKPPATALACSGVTLPCGSVTDGQCLKRSGASLIGATCASATAIDGSLTATRIPVASDSNTLIDYASLTYDEATLLFSKTSTGVTEINITNGSAGASASRRFMLTGDVDSTYVWQKSANATGSFMTGILNASLSIFGTGAGAAAYGTQANAATYFFSNNTLRGMFAADGGFHLKDSSAAVSAANDVALRSNDGVFEVSQNGGAFAAVGSGGGGWVSTALTDCISYAGLTTATLGYWKDDYSELTALTDRYNDDDSGGGATTIDETYAGGWLKLTSPGGGVTPAAFSAKTPKVVKASSRFCMRVRFAVTALPAGANLAETYITFGANGTTSDVRIGFRGDNSTTKFSLYGSDGSAHFKTLSEDFAVGTYIAYVYGDGTTLGVRINGGSEQTQAVASFTGTNMIKPVGLVESDLTGVATVFLDQMFIAWDTATP